MELLDGQVLHCLWVSRDPEDQGEGGRSSTNITLASSFNSSIDITAHSARNVRNNLDTYEARPVKIEIGKQIELYDFKLHYFLSQVLNYDKSTVLMLKAIYKIDSDADSENDSDSDKMTMHLFLEVGKVGTMQQPSNHLANAVIPPVLIIGFV